ncbi:RHS repeat-associated core domain-containing protein [Streptococcus ruminantium]|nr:RHS repeat-associated core domain-containing protein [Streptococcus ruminantium]MDQ8775218.1 RHS repeat-associated core domain-containing protein [Streptococcus ruminantium]MDQ8794393.1 RHS repeat-associated core domain-containing protein [Streptococcus ruminantium]MDQ8805759.1 RHS repeat-associated core domain-containing protein [Streptococcus ruminantium]MDQ8817067.1 RHS repeat-associated core domain-containing protein [Streptococcus ruminantium]MDQ8818640.1 RHS repeat-associated core dom
MVYSSEVQEVLIPYTTKKDTYHYYETRNYVNDVNRQHTQVLQTYDAQLKKRETYTYGRARSNYRNESTGKSYFYLTNQSGSVTGLTEHGEAVASSSYGLYGATKQTTDQTGQPFAYNGEARDVTGLDYLRARYYDSQTGTFLTADSYQGSRTDPLSHNLYTYVQNNPANYTDPSGHYGSPFAMMEGGRGRPVRGYSQPKPLMNPTDGTLYAPSTPEHRAHQVRQQQTQIYSYNYTPSHNAPRTSYQQTLWQQAQVQRSISNAWEQAKAIGQSVYDWGASRTREAANIARNWTKSLEETITHVCTTAERWVQSVTTNKTNIRVADFHKIEEANKYGLTVAEKTKIDTMSMADLKAKYSSVIGNYNTYIGTGYFNPLANGENRAVIERYKILKAEEEAKIAAKAAEMNKYHYLNLYKTIAETGLRPDGTPATDLEKKIASFVPLIPIVQAGAAAFAGYQYSKYSSSVPTGNGAKWGSSSQKTFKPGELENHYNKHGQQVANALNRSTYTIEQYLDDANYVIQTGEYSSKNNAYYKYIGFSKDGNGQGSTKYAVVGLDRVTGEITTYHIKNVKKMYKWDSSLGIKP